MVNLYDRVTSIGGMYYIWEDALYDIWKIHCIYNTIQYTKNKNKNKNTIQYNTIQYNTLKLKLK